MKLLIYNITMMRCAIWYHLHNLKNVKNTHGGVLILVKLQASACNFTKINTPPWVFLTFFKLYKWYQIAQRTTTMRVIFLCTILALCFSISTIIYIFRVELTGAHPEPSQTSKMKHFAEIVAKISVEKVHRISTILKFLSRKKDMAVITFFKM